jgi:nicotinate-nucleotide--dimethylbenzimidazole phosphoribosyltransferase
MDAAQCRAALTHGAAIVQQLAASGCNTLGFGEMGIGNTASASLLTHCLTGLPLADVVGRGTGLDDAGLERKRTLLQQALDIWPQRPHFSPFPCAAEREAVKRSPQAGEAQSAENAENALCILSRLGGFEIAMLTGAMLAAAQAGMTLVIDGFIVTSALLVACRIAPEILGYCVFSHRSHEAGHRLQLDWLQVQPLLDLDLRLGEGSGAALALPLLRTACAVINEMASFAAAGVSEK